MPTSSNLSNVLQGIANPAIADIPGAIGRGQDRRIAGENRQMALDDRQRKSDVNAMAGEILSATVGGKIGALGKVDPSAALELSKALGIPLSEKERMESMLGDIQIAAAIYESGDPRGAAQFAAKKASMLENLGVRPTQYLETIKGLMSNDPAEVEATGNSLIQLRDSFVAKGLLQAPGDGGDEVRKEVRASLRKSVDEIGKGASTLETNYNKIQSLAAEVGKGNRTATAQALISLVKLGDPTSTVREGEMTSQLNTQNPIAAVADYLRGSNVADDVVSAVTAAMDPLNPKNVNVPNMLATASSLVSANVPALQASFAEAQQQAGDNLNQAGIRSIFPQRMVDRIGGLSRLLPQKQAASSDKSNTIEMVDANGTRALVDKTTGKVIREL